MSNITQASKHDLEALLAIENACFSGDKISRRSFQNFIKAEHNALGVLREKREIIGYALVLFRTGTSLARLYSLAVLPTHQGKGFAKSLLLWAEQLAQENGCAYLRLEVSQNNTPAVHLYQRLQYNQMGTLKAYYEDGSNGWRMEKRLHPTHRTHPSRNASAYYQQTTDFTCGPASLMMAMKSLQPQCLLTRNEEIQIWREATTVFMTSGHGGCSAHGLALSAWRRKLSVNLMVSSDGIPFIDGVRQTEKKEIIALVHQDFLQQIAQTNIRVLPPSQENLAELLATQKPILALISTWQLNRNKAPHWVVITASDEKYVYINDPDIDDQNPLLTQTDFEHIPIAKSLFWRMACFGQQKLRAFIHLSVDLSESP